jgi:hypothetical protein
MSSLPFTWHQQAGKKMSVVHFNAASMQNGGKKKPLTQLSPHCSVRIAVSFS